MIKITIKNKKAEAIGSTLTWISATFVLILVIAMFMALSILIFKTSWGSGKTNAILSQDSQTIMTSSMINFLKMKDSSGLTNEEIIRSWAVSKNSDQEKLIRKNIEAFVSSIDSPCAIFQINPTGGSGDATLTVNKIQSSISSSPAHQQYYFDRSSKVYIRFNNKLGFIRFFQGACYSF